MLDASISGLPITSTARGTTAEALAPRATPIDPTVQKTGQTMGRRRGRQCAEDDADDGQKTSEDPDRKDGHPGVSAAAGVRCSGGGEVQRRVQEVKLETSPRPARTTLGTSCSKLMTVVGSGPQYPPSITRSSWCSSLSRIS